jgi:hypothetical protein
MLMNSEAERICRSVENLRRLDRLDPNVPTDAPASTPIFCCRSSILLL